MLDRKTGEKVHFLFAVRAGRISKNYINDTVIPVLCRKAGIPAADDEQAAVEDGQAALDQLLQRLADVPTPAGTTPHQLAATALPIVAVNHGRPVQT